MRAPRTDAGRDGLAALLAAPNRALLALDYDGTLAPIVPRPEDAVPAEGAVAVLRRLAQVLPVALVTGRPADAVVRLAGLDQVPGLVVLGQYGAQRWRGGSMTQTMPSPGLRRARRELPSLVAGEGADVEDKGLSLVVHTRRAPDPGGALARLRPAVTKLGQQCGLEVHLGRLVLELRPPGYDKGAALLGLAHGCSAVLYAGDDVGDLAAFEAADRLRDKGIPAVLVCSDSEEGPEALRARADLVVPGPAGVVALLEELAAAVGQGR